MYGETEPNVKMIAEGEFPRCGVCDGLVSILAISTVVRVLGILT